MKKIVIVGAGFGGIRAALDLARCKLPDVKITLVSDKSHFEYFPTLYKVVTGRSPLEVCIPLDEIFKNKNIEIIKDRITAVDSDKKILKGGSGSNYNFDYLILALGSETSYFNVPGLPELAFSFKSINEALKLKNHLHELFESKLNETKEESVSNLHILVVGGGATGVELAGELVSYMRKLAENHKIDPSLVTVDLIEAAPRLMPNMPVVVSAKVLRRLHSCGVNVYLNRTVMKEDIETVFLKDMTMKSKTVIWTAGTKTNHLYAETKGLQFDKKGRVLVNEYLEAQGLNDIFVIGDAASTAYSGLAQTALYDGGFSAKCIAKRLAGEICPKYEPKKVSYVIPVGPGWAVAMIGGVKIYGRLAWWLRRLVDLKFFMSILPLGKAFAAFQSGKKLCESCENCLAQEN